jgi:hypothetical protein
MIMARAFTGFFAPLEFPFQPQAKRRKHQNQQPDDYVIEGAKTGN